jgi:hypothetical protein
MMSTTLAVQALLVVLGQATQAVKPAEDQSTMRNLVFVEVGGNGLLCTVNYDRRLTEHFAVRIGVGRLPEGAYPFPGEQPAMAGGPVTGIPMLVSFVSGESRHRLELGVGVTIFHVGSGGPGRSGMAAHYVSVPTAFIGYRFVPREGGFTYRFGFTPLLGSRAVLPWAGLSFGYLF